MTVKLTHKHTQIEIDVKLPRDEYSVNVLMTNDFLLIYMDIIEKQRLFYLFSTVLYNCICISFVNTHLHAVCKRN